MMNKRTAPLIFLFFFALITGVNAQSHNHGSTQPAQQPAQQPAYQPHPKNVEIAARFNYYLDNGIEQIDLLKVPSINKNFFAIGKPRLVIYDKNDPKKTNLLVSFTLMVEPNIKDFHGKAFQNYNQFFSNDTKSAVSICPKGSKITFVEVRLTTTLPQAVQQAPGSKYVLPQGMLPVAFYLMIE